MPGRWRGLQGGPRPTYFDGVAAQAAAATEARLKLILKAQDAAHRRHLTALKTLATVRKLLKPAISPVDLALRPIAESRPARAYKHPRLSPAAASPVLN